eukprot:g71703.t1
MLTERYVAVKDRPTAPIGDCHNAPVWEDYLNYIEGPPEEVRKCFALFGTAQFDLLGVIACTSVHGCPYAWHQGKKLQHRSGIDWLFMEAQPAEKKTAADYSINRARYSGHDIDLTRYAYRARYRARYQYRVSLCIICGLAKDEKVQREEYNSDMSFDKWKQRKSSDYKELLKSVSPEDKAKALNEAKEILGAKKSSWKGSAKFKAKLKDTLDEGIDAFGPLESGSVKDFEDQKGRLVRWQQELAEYHFTIEYLKGMDNVKADTMSRQGKDKIEQEEIKEDEVYSIRVRLEDPVHGGTGYARFRFTTPESVFAMSGCTLSLEELENDRDFDKKKPRGLACYKRDNWKTSVHFVSEEAYAFQAATEPLPDICCKDCLDSRIYEVLWKESEKEDSLYDTQDVMDYEKSWKEVSEESAFPDHGGLVYPLEGKSLEDRVKDLGDQHPDRAALVQEDRLDIRIASVEAFKRLTKSDAEYKELVEHMLNPSGKTLTEKIKNQMKYLTWKDDLIWFKGPGGAYEKQEDKWTIWVPKDLRLHILEAEALGRIQDGFKNPPKVDEKEAEENTNIQIGDEEIAEEHKREQSRQAVQRAGLFKTEDSEIKMGSIPMDTEEESSPEPTETEEVKRDRLDHKHSKLEPIGKLWLYGQDTGWIKWRQGSFYLMKPNQKSVGDDTLDDLYSLKIVGKLPSKEERTLGITPVMQFWRSEEAVEKP